jgi:hypothetical protein
MILLHMPSKLSITLCMKEGLTYLMVTLAYHLPYTELSFRFMCLCYVNYGLLGCFFFDMPFKPCVQQAMQLFPVKFMELTGIRKCFFGYHFLSFSNYSMFGCVLIAGSLLFYRIIPVDNDQMRPPNICMDKEHLRVYEKQVELLLSEGLGERARLVRVLRRSIPANWHIDEVCSVCQYTVTA